MVSNIKVRTIEKRLRYLNQSLFLIEIYKKYSITFLSILNGTDNKNRFDFKGFQWPIGLLMHKGNRATTWNPIKTYGFSKINSSFIFSSRLIQCQWRWKNKWQIFFILIRQFVWYSILFYYMSPLWIICLSKNVCKKEWKVCERGQSR